MKTLMLAAVLAISMAAASPPTVCAAAPSAAEADFQILPNPGEKIPLNADYYFIYEFDKPPKLGMAIMRVEIFNRDGNRDTSFVVKGDADMPSMRGAHSSGEKDFALSAKGVYLLPIRLVMPGDWEIRFTFLNKERVIFRGAYLFDL